MHVSVSGDNDSRQQQRQYAVALHESGQKGQQRLDDEADAYAAGMLTFPSYVTLSATDRFLD